MILFCFAESNGHRLLWRGWPCLPYHIPYNQIMAPPKATSLQGARSGRQQRASLVHDGPFHTTHVL